MFVYCAGSILALYAVGGRGISHLPVGPVYVGEVGLLTGALVIALGRHKWNVLRQPATKALLCFCAWGAVCTVPHLSRYGGDALRDAVTWLYAVYALAWALVVSESPWIIPEAMQKWRTWGPYVVGLGVCVRVMTVYGSSWIPQWASGVPVVQVKGEDIGPHLAAVTVGAVAAMASPVSLIVVGVGLMSVMTVRTALVSYGFCTLLGGFLVRRARRLLLILVAGALCAGILNAFSIELAPSRLDRRISIKDAGTYLASIVVATGEENADGTREWRLEWWKRILNYTVLGEHFWFGKGFGVNLADDDGFQIGADGSLRSPHNSHLTVLARMGVPGAIFWTSFLSLWLLSTVRAYIAGWKKGRADWSRALVLVLVYWVGMLLVACFDVYLEGPSGGILFWSITGIGIGAAGRVHNLAAGCLQNGSYVRWPRGSTSERVRCGPRAARSMER